MGGMISSSKSRPPINYCHINRHTPQSDAKHLASIRGCQRDNHILGMPTAVLDACHGRGSHAVLSEATAHAITGRPGLDSLVTVVRASRHPAALDTRADPVGSPLVGTTAARRSQLLTGLKAAAGISGEP